MICVRGSRLLELLARRGATSLCDPLMGLPSHLNYLKRHGIAVHGGDSLEWLARVGDGIVVNDATLLRDEDAAGIVEMTPGIVYALHLFSAWEGATLGEEQCRYLSVWHQNVRALRSDAHVGLAVLGLWRVFCYWLQKAEAPDELEDVAPSELAWFYVRQTAQWVATNGRRNSVRCASVDEIVEACPSDALFLALPSKAERRSDPRIAMWEAWWHGNPFLAVEEQQPALPALLARSAAFRIVIVLTDEGRVGAAEAALRSAGRAVERAAYSPQEIYLIAERSESAPR